MKECWINVYEDWSLSGNKVWYGECHTKRLMFTNKDNEFTLLYRIHVRLKNEKP